MNILIKATKDNQELLFKNFLDCLRYFLANGDEKASKKDVNYSKYHSAFIRSNYKCFFEFALVEKVEAEKIEAFKHNDKLYAKDCILLIPYSCV